jgi:hypothetical protein
MRRYQVTLHNVSPNGVGFYVDEPLAVGTVLGLQRAVRSHTGSWVRSGRVVHCTLAGDRYLVGCMLSPAFTEDELQALV